MQRNDNQPKKRRSYLKSQRAKEQALGRHSFQILFHRGQTENPRIYTHIIAQCASCNAHRIEDYLTGDKTYSPDYNTKCQ